ncbi:hypothetical protein RJ641_020302 [Dillenia turbinata]|uniref:Uncharacterized protein n=1 Tax=Dillenia turbinata TaxID=194707 RepID=A0AAN8UGJ0_9MAGN
MFVMCCAMGDASVLFKTNVESRSENLVFWNVMIDGYIRIVSSMGVFEFGKWVHLNAEKNEIETDEKLGSVSIDMYSMCASIDKAIQLFLELSVKM